MTVLNPSWRSYVKSNHDPRAFKAPAIFKEPLEWHFEDGDLPDIKPLTDAQGAIKTYAIPLRTKRVSKYAPQPMIYWLRLKVRWSNVTKVQTTRVHDVKMQFAKEQHSANGGRSAGAWHAGMPGIEVTYDGSVVAAIHRQQSLAGGGSLRAKGDCLAS